MISPFVDHKVIRNGLSYGLSAASYDLRIAHNLTLGPSPSHVLLDLLDSTTSSMALNALRAYAHKGMPPSFALAHTIERFHMPTNVMGFVCDKSTYARFGVSCLNTMFDPGFRGVGTLELVNLSPKVIVIRGGDPICQMVFQWLDEPTDSPYAGKFQDQPSRPVGARLEQEDGSYVEAAQA